jgi:anti-sigma factor RsiW
MTTPRPQPPEPHEAALLLPWYVSGTLAERERRMVEAHLRDCAECRGELASIVNLRQRTQAMFAGAPPPSPHVRAAVMAGVRQPQSAQAAEARSPTGAVSRPARRSRPLLAPIAEVMQMLMRPSWAPALAVLLIVVQAGALSWLVLQPRVPEPQVQSRGIESSAARIRVAFNPHATEQEIRAALTALGGRIVDGPSADGAYLIELPELEPKVLSERLRELRAQPGIVERIENAVP